MKENLDFVLLNLRFLLKAENLDSYRGIRSRIFCSNLNSTFMNNIINEEEDWEDQIKLKRYFDFCLLGQTLCDFHRIPIHSDIQIG